MVARSGRGWVLAPSLEAAWKEANRIAPNRSRKSDGSIGDAAHAASASDHNPSGGFVTALDLTWDPRGGFDAHAWADQLSTHNDPRVKYLISRGRIWNPTIGDRPGVWRPYRGSNPHVSHLHISIKNTPSARNDNRPWFKAEPPSYTPPTVSDVERFVAARRQWAATLLPYVQGMPDLAGGTTSLHVVNLQRALNLVSGVGLVEDGVYGDSTITAVLNFQRFLGIKDQFPGAAGPVTRWMLATAVKNIADGRA